MTETRLQEQLPRVPLAKQGRDIKQKCGRTACRESSQEKWMEAEGLCLLHAARADLLSLSRSQACRSVTKTTHWKAGCGKTACPVWREGWPSGHPYPYPEERRQERSSRGKLIRCRLEALRYSRLET